MLKFEKAFIKKKKREGEQYSFLILADVID